MPSGGLVLKIAFLGWGSLVWNPKNLEINGKWEKDGPFLPIEFARVSNGERLTLVLYSGAAQVPALWAMANSNKLKDAVRNLACRECTPTDNIGFIRTDGKKESKSNQRDLEPKITEWSKQKGLDAVVWTDLTSNFKEKLKIDFNPKNAVDYLKKRKGQAYQNAQQYIRNAPKQIDTEARREIEKELSWTCIDYDFRKLPWFELRKNFEEEKRVVKKARDDSYWIVVPREPAAFGHLLVIS